MKAILIKNYIIDFNFFSYFKLNFSNYLNFSFFIIFVKRSFIKTMILKFYFINRHFVKLFNILLTLFNFLKFFIFYLNYFCFIFFINLITTMILSFNNFSQVYFSQIILNIFNLEYEKNYNNYKKF